jgi:cysteinyl-tRNA synthetase
VDDAETERYITGFHRAMDDDFNTPEAVAVLFELAREVNRCRDSQPERARRLAGCMRRIGAVLGLLQASPEAFLRASVAGDSSAETLADAEIEAMVASRISARAGRNWAEADRIRAELEQHGIILEDAASGTSWRRA